MKTSVSFKPSTAFSIARKLVKVGRTVAKVGSDIIVHVHTRQHVTIVVKGFGKVSVKRNNKGVVINGIQHDKPAQDQVVSFGAIPVLSDAVVNEQTAEDKEQARLKAMFEEAKAKGKQTGSRSYTYIFTDGIKREISHYATLGEYELDWEEQTGWDVGTSERPAVQNINPQSFMAMMYRPRVM